MWLDIKKFSFVIFVVAIFSLLAVQPAFSLESDFISNGNNTIGIPITGSHADWMNDINSKNLNAHNPKLTFKERPDGSDNNRIVLRHDGFGNDNIRGIAGNFDVTFDIPKGSNFTFEVVIYRSTGIQTSKINITVTTDGNTRSTTIDKNTDASWHGATSVFLVNESENTIGITDNRPTINWNGWFDGDSKDYTIKIDGYQGYKLEFYVIFQGNSSRSPVSSNE